MSPTSQQGRVHQRAQQHRLQLACQSVAGECGWGWSSHTAVQPLNLIWKIQFQYSGVPRSTKSFVDASEFEVSLQEKLLDCVKTAILTLLARAPPLCLAKKNYTTVQRLLGKRYFDRLKSRRLNSGYH